MNPTSWLGTLVTTEYQKKNTAAMPSETAVIGHLRRRPWRTATTSRISATSSSNPRTDSAGP